MKVKLGPDYAPEGTADVELVGRAPCLRRFVYVRRKSDGQLLLTHENKLEMSKQPYRFRESTFRKYETHIKRITDEWPGPTTFEVEHPESFACKIRDCVKSLRDNQWDTKVNPAKFIQICDDIVVSVKGDVVIAGEREMVRRAPEPVRERSPMDALTKVSIPDEECIEALCTLLHFRVITDPVRCDVSRMPEIADTVFHELEGRFDVAIERKDPNTILLI